MKFFKKNSGLIIIFLLSIFSILPLFQSGFFPMHDDTQVVRVYEMGKALKDGMLPVRWSQDLGYGYGYPLFNFYSPLPYYFGGLLNFLGVDVLISTKVMMAVGILLAGLFMYFLAREFWGEWGGVVSAAFYVFVPYHALDIYVRGAVGEFWAYAFLPLIVLGFYKLMVVPQWKWIAVEAVGFSGVILSHNLTAMMVMPILLIVLLFYCFIAVKRKKILNTYYLILATIFGLSLSAFYWLPALLEMSYTNVLSQIGGGADFKDHFVCVQQLWNSPWGFGGSVPGCIDGMSFKIGKLHLILALAGLFLVFFPFQRLPCSRDLNHENKRIKIIVSFIFGVFLLSVFMTTSYSKSIWEAFLLMAYIQYPWRFLVLVSFSSSFLAGALIWFLKRFNTVMYLSGGLVLIVLLLYPNLKLFQPQTIFPRTADFYTNPENIKWTTSKISDEYLPRDFLKPENRENIVKNRISEGKIIIDKTQELLFGVDNEKEKEILVKIAPFPGWRAFIDGNSVNYISKNNGIEIFIPKGKHEVKILFFSTAVEQWANLISLIGLLALLSGILLRYRYAKS